MPNEASDKARGDILFLLDGSSSMEAKKFARGKQLIADTLKQFRNIGADGVQVGGIGARV